MLKVWMWVYEINSIIYEPLGGGATIYKKGGDSRREISIEPLKGTNLGVALAGFYPGLKGTNQKQRDKQLVSMNLIAMKIKTSSLVSMNLIAMKIKAPNTFRYQSFWKTNRNFNRFML